MNRFAGLGRWWWRWLLLCGAITGIGLAAVVLLPFTSLLPPPRVLAAQPQPGAAAVALHQPLRLRFSTPMDRASVEAATRIIPAVPGSWSWPDAYTAVWEPAPGWLPATTHQLRLERSARSQARQPLAASFVLEWTTVAEPVVEQLWPAANTRIATSTPFIASFNQPMQTITPTLLLEPVAATMTRWSDPQTLLISGEWQPDQVYTATLTGISDLPGTAMRPLQWHFSTRSPTLLNTLPPTTTMLAATQPLTWTFDGMLSNHEIAALTATISITPNLAGHWNVGLLETGRTQLSWQPEVAWSGSVSAGLAQQLPRQWQLAEPLHVSATLPGRGGSITSDQEVRLIFNQPPNRQLLQESLTITPAVEPLFIEIAATQASLRGAFLPGTAYTLTLTSAGQPFTLPFGVAASVTNPPTPSNSVIYSRPGQPVELAFAPFVSSATARLFAVDRGLILAALNGASIDMARFKLEPLHSWAITATLPVTLSVPDLSSGSYILQIQTGTTPPAVVQRLIIVSPLQVLTTAMAGMVSTLVIDSQTGAPVPGIDLELLRSGSQLAKGQTDAAGLWQTTLPPEQPPDLVVGLDASAMVLTTQIQTLPLPTSAITASVAALTPQRSSLVVLGHSTTSRRWISAEVQDAQGQPLTTARISVQSDGVFSTTLRLNAADARLLLLDDTLRLPLPPVLHVNPRLTLLVPPMVLASDPFTATLAVRQDIAGAFVPFAWQLHTLDGSPIASGTGQTNAAGLAQLELVAPPVAAATPVLLDIQTATSASTSQQIVVQPSQQLILSIDQQLAQPGASLPVRISLSSLAGSSAAQPYTLTVTPAGTILRGQTSAAGEATISWRVPASGSYTLQASTAQASSAPISVWVASPGYRGWSDPPGVLELALDRSTIAPGQPLHILPLTAARSGTILITWSDGQQLSTSAQRWSAGTPLLFNLPNLQPGQHTLGISLISLEQEAVQIRSGRITITQTSAASGPQIATVQGVTLAQSSATPDAPLTIDAGFTSASGVVWQRWTSASQLTPLTSASQHPIVVLVHSASGAAAAALLPLPTSLEAHMLVPDTLIQGDTLVIAGSAPLDARLDTTSGLAASPLAGSEPFTATLQALAPGTQVITLQLATTSITRSITVLAPPIPGATSARWITRTTIISDGGLSVVPGLNALQNQAAAELRSDPTLPGAASRIALAQLGGDRTLLSHDIALLRGALTSDNAWSWDGHSSNPLLTALITRFLATGTPEPDVQPLIEQALRWLERNPPADLAQQAAVLAAQARAGRPVGPALERLLAQPGLPVDSQILLISALLDQGSPRRAERLLSPLLLSTTLWTAAPALPWDSVSRRAALLGQIIYALDPASPQLSEILAMLAHDWQVSGWGNPVTTGDALLALAQLPAQARSPSSYRVTADSTTLHSGFAPWDTSAVTRPLTIEPSGRVLLVHTTSHTRTSGAVRVWGSWSAAPPNQQQRLHAGQPVVLEWTILTTRPLEFADLELALPAGMEPQISATADWTLRANHLYATRLVAGVHTLRMLVWPHSAGQLQWPAPLLSSAGRPVSLQAALPSITIAAPTDP